MGLVTGPLTGPLTDHSHPAGSGRSTTPPWTSPSRSSSCRARRSPWRSDRSRQSCIWAAVSRVSSRELGARTCTLRCTPPLLRPALLASAARHLVCCVAARLAGDVVQLCTQSNSQSNICFMTPAPAPRRAPDAVPPRGCEPLRPSSDR